MHTYTEYIDWSWGLIETEQDNLKPVLFNTSKSGVVIRLTLYRTLIYLRSLDNTQVIRC
uniref:Uncharacterized protein n=1 Tax=Anguilla anguilla TaxID=7936 RepID=A0A0E9WY22_ANGAN